MRIQAFGFRLRIRFAAAIACACTPFAVTFAQDAQLDVAHIMSATGILQIPPVLNDLIRNMPGHLPSDAPYRDMQQRLLMAAAAESQNQGPDQVSRRIAATLVKSLGAQDLKLLTQDIDSPLYKSISALEANPVGVSRDDAESKFTLMDIPDSRYDLIHDIALIEETSFSTRALVQAVIGGPFHAMIYSARTKKDAAKVRALEKTAQDWIAKFTDTIIPALGYLNHTTMFYCVLFQKISDKDLASYRALLSRKEVRAYWNYVSGGISASLDELFERVADQFEAQT